MRWVWVPELQEGRCVLDKDVAHHLESVIRLRRGERVWVTNGAGMLGEAELQGQGKSAFLEVGVLQEQPPMVARVLLLGQPDQPLIEESVVLACELGVTRLMLFPSRFSPPGKVRVDRLERLLRASIIQCRRTWLPSLQIYPSLPAALTEVPPTLRFYGKPQSPPLIATHEPITLAIGPEGGFSNEETTLLEKHQFSPAGLSTHILRAPTAIACALSRVWAG